MQSHASNFYSVVLVGCSYKYRTVQGMYWIGPGPPVTILNSGGPDVLIPSLINIMTYAYIKLSLRQSKQSLSSCGISRKCVLHYHTPNTSRLYLEFRIFLATRDLHKDTTATTQRCSHSTRRFNASPWTMVQVRKPKVENEHPVVPSNLVIPCLFMLSLVFLSLFVSSAFGWFAQMATFTKMAPVKVVMPKIGLGTFLLDREKVRSTILKALELGYRRIDCAPVYFNEDLIGDVLEEQSMVRREELFIVSKLACPFHKQQHVERALLKSLSDLRLDYLDLYLVHWPIAFKYVPISRKKRGYEDESIDDSNGGKNIDNTVSLLETWRSMEHLVKRGLVKHIGLSNIPVALLNELLANDLRVLPSVVQVELHPYLQQNNLVKFCLQRGIHVQAYSPLGSPGYKDSNEPMLLDDMKEIAVSGTPAQVAIAWALQRETSVVVKGTSEAHLKENLKAESIILRHAEIKKIDALNRNYRFFRPEGKSLFHGICSRHFTILLAYETLRFKTGGDLRVQFSIRNRCHKQRCLLIDETWARITFRL